MVIKLVEPVAAYPSCPLMPRSISEPPLCGKYRQLGYAKCADLEGCRNTEACGCIPSACNCGDFDCMYGARTRPLQLVDSTPFTWPEWSRAQEPSSESLFGQASACCNYSTSAVSQTPDGGGCCAIQRFRQLWIDSHAHWIGVRAFEITSITTQGGCEVYLQEDQCNKQSGCTFDAACGCIATGGTCAHPCAANLTVAPTEVENRVCVERCPFAPVRANVTVVPVLLSTGHEPGQLPASFTVALDSEPKSIVKVRIESNPCQLQQLTHSTLTFTPQNWSDPQTVQMAAVSCNPSTPIPPFSHVKLQTASADARFESIPVSPIPINIDRGDFCPMLRLPENAIVERGQREDAIADSNFVFILNYYCRSVVE